MLITSTTILLRLNFESGTKRHDSYSKNAIYGTHANHPLVDNDHGSSNENSR